MVENKLDKVKKLEEVKSILKTEFIGLDNIIDEIINSIKAWYITPEVINRPIIVSLWGMTGTGKTSVVKRLIQLLDLVNGAVFFDCGGESSDSSSYNITDKVQQFLNMDNIEKDFNISLVEKGKRLVFVFDEFQYARSIDESGRELIKANLRPVWNIVDDGILNIPENNYEVGYFSDFFEDISEFSKQYPNIPLNKMTVENPNDVKLILENLGYFYFNRGVPGKSDDNIEEFRKQIGWTEKQEDELEDQLRPLILVSDRIIRCLVRNLNVTVPSLIKELNSVTNISELVQLLREKEKIITKPKTLDCSNSLVFIIGNLDEAFGVENDTNPDIDADIFYDQTSRVSVMDIKKALESRFRAEQIARFGNTLIKYPTLKKEHFRSIIVKEVNRICNEFYKSNNIKININEDVINLLYSEGVYPVQGVRPVFTTIGTILTPLLSDILIHNSNSNIESVYLEIKNPELGYQIKEKEIILKYSDGNYDSKIIPLALGELRNPINKKTRYINAVHESGHAIMMAYLTGTLPLNIIAVSPDGGGFCITYDSEKTNEIESRKDVNNEVMISLGGYESELLIYGNDNKDRCLLGSGSDIEKAWNTLNRAFYKLGYMDPYSFCNFETTRRGSYPDGLKDDKVRVEVSYMFNYFRTKTSNILSENKNLIKKMALELGETGNMTKERFLELIKTTEGNSLTLDRLKEAKIENSYDFYKKFLTK